jgi:DNA segregation ATPase FtsK/SpoIIIE, S-DNA-T family
MAKQETTTAKNVLKEEVSTSKKQVKTKPAKKAKSPIKFFQNEKMHRILGSFFILLSAYLLIAFTSYFLNWFTWGTDDLFRHIHFSRLLFDNTLEVHNWAGRMGAALSEKAIKEGFGVASYLIAIILLVWGVRLLLKHSLIHSGRVFTHSIIMMVWLSVSLGFILKGTSLSILGGTVGFQGSLWLEGMLGKLGEGFVLLFSLITYLILVYNFSFKKSEKETDSINADPAFAGDEAFKNAPLGSDFPFEDKYNTVEFAVKDEKHDPMAFTSAPPIALRNEKMADEESIPSAKHPVPSKLVELTIEPVKPDTIEPTPRAVKNEIVKDSDEKEHFTMDTPFDPRLDLSEFRFPTLDLLDDYGNSTISVNKEELEANKNRIVSTLANYSIQIDKIKATIGPTVTLYEIIPAPGVRISRIKNLEDDIALSLSAMGIRIVAPIPGKGTIGIEVPNLKPEIVSMKSILGSDKFKNSDYELPFGIGKTIANESFVVDLTRLPHILMAGATGQGKSVGLNAIIASLLYKKHPAELKFIMVDPKKVELTLFSKIERHYLAKLPDSEEAIITDTRKVVRTLNSLNIEMDNRYDLLKDAQVRNIKEYNTKFIARKLNPAQGHHFLPYLVLVIDEFADLIMTAGKEIEVPLTRLAQLARAIGIHLIIATQRPSVNIITGTIKANFPARIAFRVISKIDSRTILDSGGADQLVGRGDMLLSTGSDLIRLQCGFVDTHEVERVTEFIGSQRAYPSAYALPEFNDEETQSVADMDPNERDELFEDAARVIVQNQQGSTSLLQRKLKLGYNRAGRIIDQLEAAGIVGPFEGSKAREVRVANEVALEQYLKDLRGNETEEI